MGCQPARSSRCRDARRPVRRADASGRRRGHRRARGAGTAVARDPRRRGAIGEAVEGSRVLVQGVTVGSSTDLVGRARADGRRRDRPVRVIVGPDALGGLDVPSGTLVVAAGPVGQRDSTGTGLAGYRIHATEGGRFRNPRPADPAADAATPCPTAAPTCRRRRRRRRRLRPPRPGRTDPRRPTPAPAPTTAPTATPSPTPTPTATTATAPAPGPTRTADAQHRRGPRRANRNRGDRHRSRDRGERAARAAAAHRDRRRHGRDRRSPARVACRRPPAGRPCW